MSRFSRTTMSPYRPLGGAWRVVAGAATLVLGGALVAAPLSPATAKPRPQLSFVVPNVHFSIPSDMPSDVKPQISITLVNSGKTATSAVKVSLPEDVPFEVVDENCPRSLGPRKSCTVTVAFTATALLNAAATLRASGTGTTTTLPVTGVIRDDTLPGDSGPPCVDGYGKCILGTAGADYTYGSVFEDQQYGLGGDDDLHGSSGDDHLFGGDGNDTVHGNLGKDDVNGGAGNDAVHGNDGADVVWGDQGSDLMYGEDGDDYLRDVWWPPDDFDYMNGGSGTDTCGTDRSPLYVTMTGCEIIF